MGIVVSHFFDFFFDIKYKTDTLSMVKLEHLFIHSNNKKRGIGYQPTRVLPLRRLFKKLNIPGGRVFIDFGCGKGRVLLIASEFGFKTIKGIEFSPELSEIAKKNCKTFKKRTGFMAEYEIFESDVVDYTIKDDDEVFFMYHPFDDIILNKVLDNISNSLLLHNRKIWIIYRNPIYANVIENRKMIVKLGEFIEWGQHFTVYANIDP